MIQGIPPLRDFTIRDPRYSVILFWALFHDFEKKIKFRKNKNKIQIFFFFSKKSYLYILCLYTSDEY